MIKEVKMKILALSVILTVVTFIGGCTEQQLEKADLVVGDANDIVAGVAALLESPPGRSLPPDLQLYGAAGIAIASIALNSWQKIKGNLMKKTTKAIVKGIELAETEQNPNPTNPVKVAIKTQLQAAGVYNQADELIRRLKAAR